MPKVLSTGYKDKMYHTIFQHKKNQMFVIMWNVDESDDDYKFKVNVMPYVEKEGDKHDGFGGRVIKKNKVIDSSN
jgi:hypothetical protein